MAIEYAPNGLDWVRLFDSRLDGWMVDETVATEPQPVIIGSLPALAPDTAPIVSPQWVEPVDAMPLCSF